MLIAVVLVAVLLMPFMLCVSIGAHRPEIGWMLAISLWLIPLFAGFYFAATIDGMGAGIGFFVYGAAAVVALISGVAGAGIAHATRS